MLWLTGNPVLALNLVLLLCITLSGLGAYVLARRLGIRFPGALLCGGGTGLSTRPRRREMKPRDDPRMGSNRGSTITIERKAR